MICHYLLFENHEQAVKLKKELTDAGCRVTIAPTPREVSLCCGVSLLIRDGDLAPVRAYLDTHDCVYKSLHTLEQEFNAHRDAYC